MEISKRVLPVVSIIIALLVALGGSPSIVSADDWDGRINECAHLGPAVIYCFDASGNTSTVGGGGIRIVAPINSVGFEALVVTQAEIDAVGIPTDGPVLIKAGGEELGVDYELWRLPDGKFMLTGVDEHGKPFEFVWSGCQAQRCNLAPELIPPILNQPAPPLVCEPPFVIFLGECVDSENL